MRNTLPSFSAVVEWENARLSELDRARRMLAELSRQMGAIAPQLDEPPELIVLHDPAAIDAGIIETCIDEAFGRPRSVPVRVMPSPGGTYYRQKNHGATLATRELVLFVDSDVVPEPDWLATLIGSFRDPAIVAVCGNTYIEPEGLYSKAFALFWFFPLRSRGVGLSRSNHFFANNVAFSRDVFLAYRFPDLALQRGQCVALAQALGRDGKPIYIHNEARVSHPPPNGFSHFVRRALAEGHDRAEHGRATGGRRYPLGALGRFRGDMVRSMRAIRQHRRDVELGPAGAIAAGGIALAYYGLSFAGETISAVSPQLIREQFPV